MAALGCHVIVCSLCFLNVIINNLALVQRELPCIRQVAWSCQDFFIGRDTWVVVGVALRGHPSAVIAIIRF
jgi:hypothetical protein